MSDLADRAQREEAANLAMAWAVHRARNTATTAGCPDCMDCGEPIPAERRQALPALCIECQRMKERK